MGNKKGAKGIWGYRTVLLTLALVLPLSLMGAVCLGTVKLPISSVYTVIRYELAHLLLGAPFPAEWAPGTAVHDVVWLIRLPRLVLAAAVGGGLSLCGVVMQSVVKNPLADPYVLGVSSGASLGATLAILLGTGAMLGGNFVGLMAFLGAFGASLAVVVLAGVGGRASSVRLLLSGAALSAVCAAVSNFLIYLADADHAAAQVLRWTMGSFGAASWPGNGIMCLVWGLSALFFWSQSRNLNLMLLGDEAALTLGTDLYGLRIIYLLICALVVGFGVYYSGIIGFVGLVVPHVLRLLFGSDHRRLIPLSALGGGVFLLWADVLCRSILPGNEIPVGILTALLGAPVFLWLMARKPYGFGG